MIATLTLMDPTMLAAFLAAGVLLNLTPGADVLFATASGMRGGWRAGVAAAIGISLGSLVLTVLAAVGLAALLAATPQALQTIRWLGAVYLAWLAWKSWTAQQPTTRPRGAETLWRAARQGFLTNILNPKVALFILAFLPQFTTPGAGPVWQQILLLGGIFAATGLVITGAYGALAGLAASALGKAGTVLNKLAACVFGGLSIRLIWE